MNLQNLIKEKREKILETATRHGASNVRVFGSVARGEADEFLAKLRVERDTSAVPGRFFGSPQCFRVGMGVNHEMFAEGLRRIEEALY